MDEVMHTLPQIPKALIDANFDELYYIDYLLQKSPLSVQYVDSLLADNKRQLLCLNQYIDNVILQIYPLPPYLTQISALFSDVQMLTKAIREIEVLVTRHVTEMRSINAARVELDSVQFILSCAQHFKRLNALQTEDLSFMALLKSNVQFLRYTDTEIGFQLDKMALREQEAAEIYLPSHLEDPFDFWTAARKKNEILLALNANSAFYKDISQIIVREAFQELTDDSLLSYSFLTKLSAFLRVHEPYMTEFETLVVQPVAAGRMRYYALLTRYSQKVDEKIYFTAQAIAAGNKLFAEFVQFFAGRVVRKFASILTGAKTAQAVDMLNLATQVENLLVPCGIKRGQVASAFYAREVELSDYLLQCAEQAIREDLKTAQSSPLHRSKNSSANVVEAAFVSNPIAAHFTTDLYQKLSRLDFLRYFFPLPVCTAPNLALKNRVSETLCYIGSAFINLLKQYLDFSSLVPYKLSKRTDFADFTRLAQGTAMPFIQLRSFATGGFVPVDYAADLPVMQYMVGLQQSSRLLGRVFAQICAILRGKNFLSGDCIEDGYASIVGNPEKASADSKLSQYFSKTAFLYIQDTIELAACALVSGRFCVAAALADSPSQVAAAREICRQQYTMLFELSADFYDEFEHDSLYILASDNFAGAAAVCGLKLIYKTAILESFLRASEEICADLHSDATDKLRKMLGVRMRVLQGESVSRKEFISIVGENGIDWWSDLAE